MVNEKRMDLLLALYISYTGIFIFNSVANLILGRDLEEEHNSPGSKISGRTTVQILSGVLTTLLVLISAVTQSVMLHLFYKFSKPYDPVWGRELDQKQDTMLVFNPEKDRLLSYRDHRHDSREFASQVQPNYPENSPERQSQISGNMHRSPDKSSFHD